MLGRFLLYFIFTGFLGLQATAQESCKSLFLNKKTLSLVEDQSWGQQTLHYHINYIFDFFKKNKNLGFDQKVVALKREDVRATLFRIQGLLKLFSPQNPKYFTKLRDYFKKIEDTIAEVDLAETLLSKAMKTNEEQIVTYFRKQLELAKSKLEVVLNEAGLQHQIDQNEKALLSSMDQLGGWISGKVEKKLIINQLSSEAFKLHKKIKNKEYSNTDIEQGLHKLRRELR